MSEFEQTGHQFYSANYGYSGIDNSAGYDMSGAEQFETVNQPFGNFDYNESATSYVGSYYAPNPPYAGNIMTPENVPAYNPDSSSGFEDELPLMEELGINFDHIWQKTLAALNPFKQTDAAILSDSDLAGPLVFCLLFGGSLLLSGKIHFGYIYGIGVLGCLAVYSLLNLMSMTGVSMSCTVSVLGYCLLPMVILSGVSVVFSLQDVLGSALSVIIILWCSLSASKLFVTALAMDQQQLLVAYPCALLYGVFALLTIF